MNGMMGNPAIRLRPTSTRHDAPFSRVRPGVVDSLAPTRSALAGLRLRPMELPLLPSVSHDQDCRCRDLQTFRRLPGGSSRKFPNSQSSFLNCAVSYSHNSHCPGIVREMEYRNQTVSRKAKSQPCYGRGILPE